MGLCLDAVAAEKELLVWLRVCYLRLRNVINPAQNPIAQPNHDERTLDLFWPLSGGCMEILKSNPIELSVIR